LDIYYPDWFGQLRHKFSRKADGQMSLKRDTIEVVAGNRRRFFEWHGLCLEDAVAGELTHGSRVEMVTAHDCGRGAIRPDWFEDTDGFVTADPAVLLLTTHADCAPVVIYDPVLNVLGQAHCGWRGLAAGIVEQLVISLMRVKGSSAEDIRGWVGPTVHSCCYPVSESTAAAFPAIYSRTDGELIRLDLVGFAMGEMVRLGLKPENVSESRICTCCNAEFSSFRRDGEAMQAMACVTGLTS